MNTIFRSQIFPRLLNTGMAKSIPSICTSYVRNFSKTVFQDISIKPRDFYQILPLRENYKFVTQKNSEAYDIEDANRDAYYEGRYTRASNSLRSWIQKLHGVSTQSPLNCVTKLHSLYLQIPKTVI